MYDILKVSGLIFEMVNSLEIYIICCITILAMIIHRLRLTIRFAGIAKHTGTAAYSFNFTNVTILNEHSLRLELRWQVPIGLATKTEETVIKIE
jgi:hypothetical protein